MLSIPVLCEWAELLYNHSLQNKSSYSKSTSILAVREHTYLFTSQNDIEILKLLCWSPFSLSWKSQLGNQRLWSDVTHHVSSSKPPPGGDSILSYAKRTNSIRLYKWLKYDI